MIRKLKTWEQFEDEFKPLSDKWNEIRYAVKIIYDGMFWFINSEKKELFGTEIEVEEIKNNNGYNYTHKSMGNGKIYGWHELWFEPEFKEIEFLSMEEVEI